MNTGAATAQVREETPEGGVHPGLHPSRATEVVSPLEEPVEGENRRSLAEPDASPCVAVPVSVHAILRD